MAPLLDAAERQALRVDPRRFAAVVLVSIAVLVALGIARFAHKDTLSPFNLDGERNVPALFSGALWVMLAGLSVLIGRRVVDSAAWYLLAALFLLVAMDEVAEVHERLEHYTGIDWQLLYLPIGLAALPLWIVIGRRLKRLGAGFAAFVAATVFALVAQPLEALQVNSHGDPRRGFRVLVVSEELLEMLAALLLALALFAALRAVTARPHAEPA